MLAVCCRSNGVVGAVVILAGVGGYGQQALVDNGMQHRSIHRSVRIRFAGAANRCHLYPGILGRRKPILLPGVDADQETRQAGADRLYTIRHHTRIERTPALCVVLCSNYLKHWHVFFTASI